MPYIRRDSNAKVIAIADRADREFNEFVSISDPDVLCFLSENDLEQTRSALASSDQDIVRVVDDLVDLLIRKQVILVTDLPEEAKQKLEIRAKLRHNLKSLDNLIVDEVNIL